jgi:hypothetical protein
MTAPARPYTPAKLAELLAKLHKQGVPVKRARLGPDGDLDIEIGGGPDEADAFDLVDMKR